MLSRTILLALRITQFLTAVILLSLFAYFHHHISTLPSDGRIIFPIIIASLSLFLSLLFILPTTHAIVHTGIDLLLAAAWFAVFGLLTAWVSDQDGRSVCSEESRWGWMSRIYWGEECAQWQAAQAFAFIAAVVWFASFVLGLLGWAKRDRAPVVVADGGETAEVRATTARTGWRRWLPKSRA